MFQPVSMSIRKDRSWFPLVNMVGGGWFSVITSSQPNYSFGCCCFCWCCCCCWAVTITTTAIQELQTLVHPHIHIYIYYINRKVLFVTCHDACRMAHSLISAKFISSTFTISTICWQCWQEKWVSITISLSVRFENSNLSKFVIEKLLELQTISHHKTTILPLRKCWLLALNCASPQMLCCNNNCCIVKYVALSVRKWRGEV